MGATLDGDETLAKVRQAMADGARLDVVRLFFNPKHKWGVCVYGRTAAGKWSKVVLIIPSDGETVADSLRILGEMAVSA